MNRKLSSSAPSNLSTLDVKLVGAEQAGTALLYAVAKADMPAIELVLKEQPQLVNFGDYDKRTPLHVAASEGQLAVVKLLLYKYSAQFRTDRWGGTALDDALRHRHAEIAQLLRSAGAKLGMSAEQAAIKLTAAAATGDMEQVREVLDNYALRDLPEDYDGRTALHLSSSNGHLEVVTLLLASGAQPSLTDRWGGTPLDDAKRNGHANIAKALVDAGGVSGKPESPPPEMFPQSGMPKATRDDSVAGGTLLAMDATQASWDEVELIEKIGAGAFGNIFKARWRGTPVAAKVLKAEGSAEDKKLALRDLRVECAILRQLRHPHICMLLGACLEAGHETMLSELMRCSMAEVLKTYQEGDRMPKSKAIKYSRQFAMGMNYLHLCSPPIIHRDLKPANLLLDFSDTLKVADFGLAKLRPLPKSGASNGGASEPFVMTGETGSYRFMAPEVFRHEQYSEKVDVYSFALILYNMLSGHAPWPDKGGVVAVAGAALRGSRPEIPRHWDETMIALIQSCWVEPAEVRPSFTAILDQLHAFHQTTFKVSYEASFKVAAPEAAPAPAPQGAGCAPGCVVC